MFEIFCAETFLRFGDDARCVVPNASSSRFRVPNISVSHFVAVGAIVSGMEEHNISADHFKDVFVYGKAAVAAAFKARPQAISKLFLEEKNNKEFADVCAWLASERRPYEAQTESDMSRMLGHNRHEGVVAITRRPAPASIKPAMREEWFAAGEKIFFADGAISARELAQIAHTAAICGISRFIVSEESVPALMSSDAWSLCGGALDALKIYTTESMLGLMRMMSERYFIVGMVREGGRRIEYGKPISFPGRIVALYVSSDANGVPADTISRCDYLLHIAEPADLPLRYTPAELSAHVLPWLSAKIKKPGAGFLERKKAAKQK